MSDLNEWLKERRRIHNAATEGPWEAHGTTAATAWSGAGDYSGPIDDREPVANASPEDVSAIVDAHSTLPNLLTAVEKVLELHQPFEWSFGYGPVQSCTECSRLSGNEGDSAWPCPTVQSVRSAIERSK